MTQNQELRTAIPAVRSREFPQQLGLFLTKCDESGIGQPLILLMEMANLI